MRNKKNHKKNPTETYSTCLLTYKNRYVISYDNDKNKII